MQDGHPLMGIANSMGYPPKSSNTERFYEGDATALNKKRRPPVVSFSPSG